MIHNICGCLFLFLFYFLPSLIALNKKHGGLIFILNLLFGWTFFGWAGALIWAIVDKK